MCVCVCLCASAWACVYVFIACKAVWDWGLKRYGNFRLFWSVSLSLYFVQWKRYRNLTLLLSLSLLLLLYFVQYITISGVPWCGDRDRWDPKGPEIHLLLSLLTVEGDVSARAGESGAGELQKLRHHLRLQAGECSGLRWADVCRSLSFSDQRFICWNMLGPVIYLCCCDCLYVLFWLM